MEFNEKQLKAIDTINGNVVITAVAGSGKTSVLANRIVNMIDNYNIEPNNILAVTFSKKAKENMKAKLDSLTPLSDYINVETFHSLALKIIQSEYGNKYKVWTTQWEKEACMNNICDKLDICSKEDVPFNDIMIYIAKQKTNMLKPKDKLIVIGNEPFAEDTMQKIYEEYELYKTNNNLIEFDDFLNIACDIFKDDKELLHNYQEKFKYILSDEYQDVSKNQALLIEYLGKVNNNTFIVGDVNQAIYSFRGGCSEYMLNFDRDWDNVKVLNLDKNYRCSADIIDVANTFALSIPESKHRNYTKTIADKGYYKKPEFYLYDTAYDEGNKIAERINELCKINYTYKDFAILARTNAQLQKIETSLHNKGIPFGIVDGKLFTELPEIQLILSYLKLSADENDNNSFRYLYNKPLRWLNKKFLQEVEGNTNFRNKSLYKAMFTIDRRNWRFKNGIDEIYDIINNLQNKKFKNVGEMVKSLRKKTPIDEFVSRGNIGDDGLSEQIDNIDSFQDICKDFKTVKELIVYLDELNKNINDNTDINKKVKLLTIHKSKGLEFPIVFIIGCSDGLLPHYKSTDIDDEKRLMYVAITRAEQELYLSSIHFYNDRILGVSPFIDDMKDTIQKMK
jgi:DNA helicase-2/ATP-dependent DNA helicase PcrA